MQKVSISLRHPVKTYCGGFYPFISMMLALNPLSFAVHAAPNPDGLIDAVEKQSREYSNKRQWAKAQTGYKRILEIRQKQWGRDDYRLVGPINDVVRVTCVDGKCADTVPYLNDLLRIRLKKLGHRNADVATTYALIAEASEKMNRYEEALINFRQAVEIRDQLFGKTAEISLRTRTNLIRVALKKKDKAAARKTLQECQTLLSATREPRPEMEKLLSYFAAKL